MGRDVVSVVRLLAFIAQVSEVQMDDQRIPRLDREIPNRAHIFSKWDKEASKKTGEAEHIEKYAKMLEDATGEKASAKAITPEGGYPRSELSKKLLQERQRLAPPSSEKDSWEFADMRENVQGSFDHSGVVWERPKMVKDFFSTSTSTTTTLGPPLFTFNRTLNYVGTSYEVIYNDTTDPVEVWWTIDGDAYMPFVATGGFSTQHVLPGCMSSVKQWPTRFWHNVCAKWLNMPSEEAHKKLKQPGDRLGAWASITTPKGLHPILHVGVPTGMHRMKIIDSTSGWKIGVPDGYHALDIEKNGMRLDKVLPQPVTWACQSVTSPVVPLNRHIINVSEIVGWENSWQGTLPPLHTTSTLEPQGYTKTWTRPPADMRGTQTGLGKGIWNKPGRYEGGDAPDQTWPDLPEGEFPGPDLKGFDHALLAKSGQDICVAYYFVSSAFVLSSFMFALVRAEKLCNFQESALQQPLL